ALAAGHAGHEGAHLRRGRRHHLDRDRARGRVPPAAAARARRRGGHDHRDLALRRRPQGRHRARPAVRRRPARAPVDRAAARPVDAERPRDERVRRRRAARGGRAAGARAAPRPRRPDRPLAGLPGRALPERRARRRAARLRHRRSRGLAPPARRAPPAHRTGSDPFWCIIASMSETVRAPGLVLTEHEFDVPLDHDRPDGERITVFAREVADPDGRERPFLVYFQGGPGSEAPRPIRRPGSPAWLDRALEEFRVLMLDQRGTGRSTPVGALAGLSPQEQADYLTHFRADSIVRDAEWIRRELGVERWSVLGQSFGGFCVTTYLSFAPEGLREAFLTGGLPPV